MTSSRLSGLLNTDRAKAPLPGGAVASIKGKNMPKFKWIVVLVIVMFVISVAINSGK